MSTIAAIPTMYRGVQFRSRLEARWAAYFDLTAFKWAYEPLDLKGYIPDFLIEGEILVEVKPAMSLIDLADSCAKVDRSGWKAEAEVLGISPEIGAHRLMHCTEITEHLYLMRHQLTRLTIDGTWDWVESTLFSGDSDAWKEAGNVVQWKSPRNR